MENSKSVVTCVSEIMTKSKTFPLKQKLAFENYGVCVVTCYVARHVINNMLAKQ